MQTREEYLQWCKDRAMAYVKRGELLEAVTSMMSDLDQHPETKHTGSGALAQLGIMAAMQATKGDRQMVERYILGFN